MKIENPISRLGYFWHPTAPDLRLPGTLSVRDGGHVELEVMGTFEKSIDLSLDHAPGRLLGEVEEFGFITLEGCRYLKKNFSFGGVTKSRLFVTMALAGVHAVGDQDILIDTFQFAVEGLDQWLGITGIAVDYDPDFRSARISYSPPDERSIELNPDTRLVFVFEYSLPFGHKIGEASIRQKAFLKLVTGTAQPMIEFKRLASRITNFLSFAIDAPVSMFDISVTIPNVEIEISEGKTVQRPLRLFYRSIPFSGTPKDFSRHQMLFRYSKLPVDAGRVFGSWLRIEDELGPSLSLFFTSRAGDHKFLEGKFLARAQALEIFHRRTTSESLFGENEFSELVSSLLKACPDEKKDWLEGRLSHGNELSLGMRLKRLFKPYLAYFGREPKPRKVVRKIVDTRNYLTHYGKSLKPLAASGNEMLRLCMRMESVLQLLYLQELGFSLENALELAKANRQFSHNLLA